jgi:hypothetical protein
MAGRMQTARGAVAIAKKNPRALLRSIGTVEGFQSALEKQRAQGQSLEFRREVFNNHKIEFQSVLARMDQSIKNQNVANIDREMDNARQLAIAMQKQIEELLLDPSTAGLAQTMRQDYLRLIGRLQHLQQLMQDARNVPTPNPPTGRGPGATGTSSVPPPPSTKKADPLGIR